MNRYLVKFSQKAIEQVHTYEKLEFVAPDEDEAGFVGVANTA